MAGNNNTREEEIPVRDSGNKAKVVSRLIQKAEKKLDSDMKTTLGDYIRLVQLQKELEEDEIKEIKVTWVDPADEAPKVKGPSRGKQGSRT